MKLSELFEQDNDLNTAIELLRQGKACYRCRETDYELILSIWTDIPETITSQQLHQLLRMCDFHRTDYMLFVDLIPFNIKYAIEHKTRILNILNNNRSFNKSVEVRFTRFQDWAQKIKNDSDRIYNGDFED